MIQFGRLISRRADPKEVRKEVTKIRKTIDVLKRTNRRRIGLNMEKFLVKVLNAGLRNPRLLENRSFLELWQVMLEMLDIKPAITHVVLALYKNHDLRHFITCFNCDDAVVCPCRLCYISNVREIKANCSMHRLVRCMYDVDSSKLFVRSSFYTGLLRTGLFCWLVNCPEFVSRRCSHIPEYVFFRRW